MTDILSLFLELFIRFFFVGLFSIGGGLATLPFLTNMGEATGWFGADTISDMVAISESTPGPIGVNMASYIGFQVSSDFGVAFGVLGSVIATIGLVTPSVIVIVIVSKMLMKFRDSKYVEFTFYGLRAASVGLITAALLSVAKIAFTGTEEIPDIASLVSAINYKTVILSIIIFICIKKFKKVHPIVLILISGLLGIMFKMG